MDLGDALAMGDALAVDSAVDDVIAVGDGHAVYSGVLAVDSVVGDSSSMDSAVGDVLASSSSAFSTQDIEDSQKDADAVEVLASDLNNWVREVFVDSQKVAEGVEVLASDWNNRIREVVIKLSSKIPEVGVAVSILVGIFWPEDKIDVFEAIKADVVKLIKEEILQYELNLHQSEIKALKDTMERYMEAQSNEKSQILTIWIDDANKLRVIFQDSTNNIHLILPLITLAVLHLTGLRERLEFGKDLYHEDNTEQWKKELEDMYENYTVDFLPNIFKKWKVWRADQVEIKSWVGTHPIAIPPFFMYESFATVEDSVTGQTYKFSVDGVDSTTAFASICQDHKTRICNDDSADMAGGISTTFLFDKFLPDNEKNFPKYDEEVFGRMFKGPYSLDLFRTEVVLIDTVPVYRTHTDQDDYSSNSGPITEVIIREWNTIDAMQFIYAKQAGQLAGNSGGGQRHDIDVTGKPINGLCMGFSNGLLTYVRIIYDDGTSSSTYGNRGGWQCAEVTANGPAGYLVSSWSYKVDYGPSNTYGPSVIQLEYTPLISARDN